MPLTRGSVDGDVPCGAAAPSTSLGTRGRRHVRRQPGGSQGVTRRSAEEPTTSTSTRQGSWTRQPTTITASRRTASPTISWGRRTTPSRASLGRAGCGCGSRARRRKSREGLWKDSRRGLIEGKRSSSSRDTTFTLSRAYYNHLTISENVTHWGGSDRVREGPQCIMITT